MKSRIKRHLVLELNEAEAEFLRLILRDYMLTRANPDERMAIMRFIRSLQNVLQPITKGFESV